LKAKALITGISGQDGSYLAKYLLEKGFEVIGTTRNMKTTPENHKKLKIDGDVKIIEMNLLDLTSVRTILEREVPDHIYGLGSQSSVYRSFENPQSSIESITMATLNILEALRFANSKTRFYHASSSEIYGDVLSKASEDTASNPKSPYAIAKLASQKLTDLYRDSYGLKSASGILFNHESPLRGQNFFSKKVIRAACQIKKGEISELNLGRIDGVRDWGWAPDFVEAMYLINSCDFVENFVVATGIGKSLQEFVCTAFGYLDLNWHEYVKLDSAITRPSDIYSSVGDPSKARNKLNWSSSTSFESMVHQMVEEEMQDSSF
jgi:GDPmannose 4,6-dehydratase